MRGRTIGIVGPGLGLSAAVALALSSSACASGGALIGLDGGATDAGHITLIDGGSHRPDEGLQDAGLPDSGSIVTPDGGRDAGPDGVADAGPVSCVEYDGVSDLWAIDPTPVSLPGDKGRLVSCAHLASYNLVEATLGASPYVLAGITAQNGYDQYVIQYISESPPGTLRHVTALAYFPSNGSRSIPLVSVQHATNGMGPGCGVTHVHYYADYMALPLVVQGMAVVATDYPGMGVDDGIAPYAVGWSEGTSALDAVRAMAQFHDGSRADEAQLSRQLLLMGHSQGGQATLFAHQLYDSSVGFDLRGSVAFAPAFGDLRGQEGYFGDAGMTTHDNVYLFLLGLNAATGYYGNTPYATWLTPSAVSLVPQILHDQCLQIGQQEILLQFPTLGDLFPPGFDGSLGACSFDGGICSGLGHFSQELDETIPGDFASSVPILMLQGEADTTVYPETTACIAQRLDLAGTPETVCAYHGADHLTVVADGIGDAVTWLEGILDGGAPEVCSAKLAETCLPDGPGSPPLLTGN